MVTAQGSPHEDDDVERELTVDELAARVGVTVRNLRAYSARGLLPPPRMVGRTGYYGREHVARLLLVREMLAEGKVPVVYQAGGLASVTMEGKRITSIRTGSGSCLGGNCLRTFIEHSRRRFG